MAKVNVGLRGWRFKEPEIFIGRSKFRPFDEIPEDPQERLMCLVSLVEEPYDACYLIHGDEKVQQCWQVAIAYGEPREEVFLCEHREPDFLYWFHEEDGRNLIGDTIFADTFHGWFAVGGHAPDGYGRLEYVDIEPDELPSPSDANEIRCRLGESFAGNERINPRDYGSGTDDRDGMSLTEDDLDGADFDTGYPTK